MRAYQDAYHLAGRIQFRPLWRWETIRTADRGGYNMYTYVLAIL